MATHSHRSGASGTASPPKRLAWGGVLAALLIVLALLASRVVQPAGASLRTPLVKLRSTVAATAPKPGQWVQLGPSLKTTEAGIPAIWVGPAPAHTAYILWLREVATNNYTFEAATMAANGIVSSPKSIFGKAYWTLLTSSPQLVAHGSVPLLVFDGTQNNKANDPYSKSCIVGAIEGSPQWTLQHWSLSNQCTTIRSAIVTNKGVLSASWANGDQVFYRIGISPTIPATGPDSTIKPSYAPFFTGQASDWATGDIYVAWTQQFSSGGKLDGYFVKDVTANAAIRKAPGSGTNSVSGVGTFGRLAIASTIGHKGIFLVYCSTGSVCDLRLWQVGAAKPIAVPGSAKAFAPAVASGPHGRLWIAWTDPAAFPEKVLVVRTNKADTRFGPVRTYSTPCSFGGVLGLGGGTWGGLDVALSCAPLKGPSIADFATHLFAPLSFTPQHLTIVNTSKNTVVFKVTDAGDPLAGAKVSVDGKNVTTDSAGTAKISFPKGTKMGKYPITVSAANYLTAKGQLVVKG